MTVWRQHTHMLVLGLRGVLWMFCNVFFISMFYNLKFFSPTYMASNLTSRCVSEKSPALIITETTQSILYRNLILWSNSEVVKCWVTLSIDNWVMKAGERVLTRSKENIYFGFINLKQTTLAITISEESQALKLLHMTVCLRDAIW